VNGKHNNLYSQPILTNASGLGVKDATPISRRALATRHQNATNVERKLPN